MNPNDLPITSIAAASSEELLAAVRRIAQGPLAVACLRGSDHEV